MSGDGGPLSSGGEQLPASKEAFKEQKPPHVGRIDKANTENHIAQILSEIENRALLQEIIKESQRWLLRHLSKLLFVAVSILGILFFVKLYAELAPEKFQLIPDSGKCFLDNFLSFLTGGVAGVFGTLYGKRNSQLKHDQPKGGN